MFSVIKKKVQKLAILHLRLEKKKKLTRNQLFGLSIYKAQAEETHREQSFNTEEMLGK